jgi:Mn-dependent DtxR family transcriptional regulator
LLTHDRVQTDEFPLTQEFLSQMLGVRRASVTLAAGALQKAGFIEYRRGRLKILDRAGLEQASCECYQVIRDEFDRLLGSQVSDH